MLILGIETSCDETATAIVENGTHVRSSIISSQHDRFQNTGGIIPEDAARQQVLCMLPVLHACLAEAKLTLQDIDAIAVTKGPGLLGSLLVGTTTAHTLATLGKKPLIGVHHTLGHLSSTWLVPPETDPHSPFSILHSPFPILTLSASGGHTDLWYRVSHTRGTLLGSTRDDAAGEAFDKGANLLGLPYPGGPAIAKAAESGDPHAYTFPLPLHDDPSLDFSFSGLKTSLRYLLRDLAQSHIAHLQPVLRPVEGSHIPHIAASYQHAICAHLIDRIVRALHRHSDIREVHLVGGVSANVYLRSLLMQGGSSRNARSSKHSRNARNARNPSLHSLHSLHSLNSPIIRWPLELSYCTDNAAMIAAAGEFLVQERGDKAYENFETTASLPLAMAVEV